MDRGEWAEVFDDGYLADESEIADSASRRETARHSAHSRHDYLVPLDDFEAILRSHARTNPASSLRKALDRHLMKHFKAELTERATHLLRDKQPVMSALSPMPRVQRAGIVTSCLATIVGLLFAFDMALTALLCVTFAYCVASMTLKGCLMVASWKKTPAQRVLKSTESPIVTILLPVHDEGMALVSLVAELERLDYPTDKLDLKFLVEETDPTTRDALLSLNLPNHFEVLTIPESAPQTKPKAMNYALPFVKGEIVGIYDAEDAPESDQIRKAVDALAAADERTVCVQCRLNHYKATETFISRMASVEYTLWFDMLLQGLSRLKLPIPLGGTSLFIKTESLKAVDGWDPFNVTEDADLGVRLARKGWRAEVIDSTTWEEPPIKVKQWCGQRSRWIKGFMVTWLVHMREPRRLVRELGWRDALAINIMLLDGFVAFLLQPLFWMAILSAFVIGGAPWSSLLEPSIAMGIAWSFGLGQVFILTAAFIAVRRRFGVRRAIWSPLIWVYWQLATIPAYRALREMFGQQSLWSKTEHGLSEAAKERRDAAMQAR